MPRRCARIHLVHALVVTLAIALSLPLHAQTSQPSQDRPADTLRPVRLVTVEPPQTRIQRQFYGQVVARQTVDLAFQVGGQLTEFPVENGQEVAQGDLLARLDPEPFDRAVARAELNLRQAQRDFDRTQSLAQSNVTSQARFDEVQTALELAELELREAKDARDDATLTAAFDGLVARRLVANFATVAEGTPVLRLHDMSEPRVQIEVPERLYRSAGDIDEITFSADLGPQHRDVPLSFAEFTAETGGIAQSFTVDLALPEVTGYEPIPGRTATVTATLQRAGGDTLAVPATALLATPERGTEVMVFTPQDASPAPEEGSQTDGAPRGQTGTVAPVPVEVVSREGAEIAVAADGALTPGMQIVSTGAHLLSEGDRVRRFRGFGEETDG